MLANPIVFPAYADPILWATAVLATWIEISLARLVLRRLGLVDPRFARPLWIINVCTWFPFLVAVDHLDLHGDMRDIGWLIGLELLVVVAESALIVEASRGRFFSARTAWRPLGVGQAAVLSLLANLASVAISIGLPLTYRAL